MSKKFPVIPPRTFFFGIALTINQQHLTIMRYSCPHCQRIDFVDLWPSHHDYPGLNGTPKNTQRAHFLRGDKNIAQLSGAVAMMGHKNYYAIYSQE